MMLQGMKRNVFPISTGFYMSDCSLRHIQFFGYGAVIASVLSYLDYLLFCQFSLCDFFSASLSILFLAVINVFLMCPKNEMLRIDTNRIIARVANAHFFWNGSIMEFIRYSACLFTLPLDGKSSIFTPYITRPQPTSIDVWGRNIFFKSALNRLRLACVWSQSGNDLVGLTLDRRKCSSRKEIREFSIGQFRRLRKYGQLFLFPMLTSHWLLLPSCAYSKKQICIWGRFLRRFGAESIGVRIAYTLREEVLFS